jgi:1-acyl-sn-glycerol-3-phosphate acyltransferase
MTLTVPRSWFGGPPRWHHRAIWLISRAFRPLLRIRVDGADKLPRTGPAVVIAPHMSYCDSFPFLYAALPRPSRFLASTFYVLSNGPLSWLMYLGGVLPLTKHVPDSQAARRALRVLAAGDVVALFPEGERAWAGMCADPITACSKFLARLNVPIFIAEIEGSYDHWPRWVNLPRYRPVTVRLHGPIELPSVRGTDSRPNGRRRWWQTVYHSGGTLDSTAARTALGSLLHDLSIAEASRLDLFCKGRFTQVARLICFCPECARPSPVADSSRLRCESCEATWRPAPGGALRRDGNGTDEPPQPLSDVFLYMLETLRTNAEAIVPIEENVLVKPMNDAIQSATAGRMRMDAQEAVVHSSSRSWQIDLPMMAKAEIQGSAVVEVITRDGGALSLQSNGGALRMVLAARALLDLPWGRGMSAESADSTERRAVGA